MQCVVTECRIFSLSTIKLLHEVVMNFNDQQCNESVSFTKFEKSDRIRWIFTVWLRNSRPLLPVRWVEYRQADVTVWIDVRMWNRRVEDKSRRFDWIIRREGNPQLQQRAFPKGAINLLVNLRHSNNEHFP
ncbi:hypothetical protein T01_773 [Trichinella spiralis]|uniref:Uncharacterized protein n=1 Tax=Trichinella spiralis TaxID=6334 RepID=A0A0V1AW75_TRISP|nr:hypothetical protein T01_773 [Trichinella spiralis]